MENIQQMIQEVTVIAPILASIIQSVKPAFPFSKKYIPSVSLVLGVAIGLSLYGLSITSALVGAALGTSAVGVYEVGKNISTKSE